ncbi:MAG: serpin family protein [Labilithrix sp.]|nr:serpin family protein [Labilithrix sp.]
MNKLNLASLAAACSAASLAAACSAASPEPPKADVEIVKSSLARDTTPAVTPAELETFAADQADFAIDLYQAVRKGESGDVFLSPHSVSTALAMTYAGARGATQTEMKKALRFSLDDAPLHRSFGYLDLALESRGKGAKGADDQPFRLRIANSIWGQKGTPFESAFLDTLAVSYGAGLNAVDFKTQPEPCRLAINAWVEDKTENRIKDLLPERSLDPDTRFVIVNAVYFNASWEKRFSKEGTRPSPFTKLDGSSVDVAMMHAPMIQRPYLRGDGFEAVEMPYDGGETSLLVIAPDKGTFATFESTLTGGKVLDVLAGLKSQPVQLALPKAKLEVSFALNGPLESMGMKRAFEPGAADFTGISRGESLSIKAVLHKTFLAIDEKGTEAAAATAVIGGTTSAPVDQPIVVNVDRPYLIAIVDRQTKTLLFVGRILEPKS